MIEMNSFLELKKGQTIDDVPSNPLPFYLLTAEGAYLRKRTLLGDALVPATELSPTLGTLGTTYKKGGFTWTAPVIPANICAQIVSFFRRIYDKHQTEAEVMLTLNHETMEWRVFVPNQRVSGAAVEFDFDPAHIEKGWVVVATAHSHCDFSAFHSSTDTNDAGKMDGAHLTVGYITREKPQVVAMVSINGIDFDFPPEQIADFSNLEADTAPEWWDRYVTTNASLVSSHKPVGWTNGGSGWSGTGWYGTGWSSSYEPYKPYEKPKTALQLVHGGLSDSSKEGPSEDEIKKDFREFLIAWGISESHPDEQEERDLLYGYFMQEQNKSYKDRMDEPYWEDFLDKKIVNAVLDSGAFTDDDALYATRMGAEADLGFFRLMFLEKLGDVIKTLEVFGIKVAYNIRPISSESAVVHDDAIDGVLAINEEDLVEEVTVIESTVEEALDDLI